MIATATPPRHPGEPWEITEAARHLHISDRHLRRLIGIGRVKSIRLGRRIMIADDELRRVAREGTGE